MTILYIVKYNDKYEEIVSIEGLFSSREKAFDYIIDEANIRGRYGFSIIEIEVDKIYSYPPFDSDFTKEELRKLKKTDYRKEKPK